MIRCFAVELKAIACTENRINIGISKDILEDFDFLYPESNSSSMETIKKYNPELNDNLIVKLTFTFSLGIVKFVEALEGKRKYAVANQLIRSGTSIGANVREAQNAESKADFIHKMKIAAKEADETEYWLAICQQSEEYPNSIDLLTQVLSIKKIIAKIISTAKQRIN